MTTEQRQLRLKFLEVLEALLDGLESGATSIGEARADIAELRAGLLPGLAPTHQEAEHEH